jgi:hypothetical protein
VDSISFEPRASQSCWKVGESGKAGAPCFILLPPEAVLFTFVDCSSDNTTNQAFINNIKGVILTLLLNLRLWGLMMGDKIWACTRYVKSVYYTPSMFIRGVGGG